MKWKKWISATCASALLASSLVLLPKVTEAESERTIIDESIYDLLVDRYFNGSSSNDERVNTQDPTQFAGGDFAGIAAKVDNIVQLGYTIVSVGSVFPTEKYDGSRITSYDGFEPHFGTEQEFVKLIETYKSKNIGIMVDFPLSNVSANHQWVKDGLAASVEGDVAKFDLADKEVQQALKEKLLSFVQTYNLAAVRLTNIEGADVAFLNELIDEAKAVNQSMYVLANAESEAKFDADFHTDMAKTFADSYKNVDLAATGVTNYVEGVAEGEAKPSQLHFDTLWSDRLTVAITSPGGNNYPPNRLPLVYAATLFMPGVPVTTYGSEIAMNGTAGPEAHQIYNFKTDVELIDKIENMQLLRNQSWTLRNGKFKLIENKDGFLAFERQSKDETWIIVINNTSVTNRVNINPELVGEGKEIRGMFDGDIIRKDESGSYPIILDREKFEVYQIIDEKGINVSYVVALSIVYILFTIFVIAIIKRSRQKRRAEKNKENV